MSKKPRILIVIPDRLNKPTGGLGVQCEHVVKNLSDKFEFDLVGHPDPENKSENYTDVYNPLPNIQHASLITAVGQIVYLSEAIERPKPDLVHAYDWSTFFAGAYVAKFFKVPLVVTMQLSINLLNQAGINYVTDVDSPDGFWINRIHGDMELYGLKEADKIIHVSNSYAKKFNEIEGLSEKSVVVPNGIDLSEWQKFEKVELPGNQKYKIIYMGRFALMKNIQALIRARVPENIDLIFVGADNGGEIELFNSMKDFVGHNNNVHYYGPAYNQERINILNSADAVIIPSVHEPFGIVALEALASKSILLSSFADGMSDFLSNECAINCGTNPMKIELAYQEFLRLSDSDRENMIKNGLGVCEKYSWHNAVSKMETAYLDVLK